MPDLHSILKRLREDEVKRFGVERIGVFGSFTRNEQHPASDLDILVEFQSGKKTFDNYMELKFHLEERFGLPVDLVIAETIKPDLKAAILGSVQYA